ANPREGIETGDTSPSRAAPPRRNAANPREGIETRLRATMLIPPACRNAANPREGIETQAAPSSAPRYSSRNAANPREGIETLTLTRAPRSRRAPQRGQSSGGDCNAYPFRSVAAVAAARIVRGGLNSPVKAGVDGGRGWCYDSRAFPP